jgi:hypothetical protein
MVVAILVLSMCFGLVTAKAVLSIILSLMHRGVSIQLAATAVSNQPSYESQTLQYTAPAA